MDANLELKYVEIYRTLLREGYDELRTITNRNDLLSYYQNLEQRLQTHEAVMRDCNISDNKLNIPEIQDLKVKISQILLTKKEKRREERVSTSQRGIKRRLLSLIGR